jgi:hypothetical protein
MIYINISFKYMYMELLLGFMALSATFNNISAMLSLEVLFVEVTTVTREILPHTCGNSLTIFIT